MRCMDHVCEVPHGNVRPAQKFRSQTIQKCLDSLSCIGYIIGLTHVCGPITSKGELPVGSRATIGLILKDGWAQGGSP